jgi:ABC-type multidrug transport system fused ATPase/permease subunit
MNNPPSSRFNRLITLLLEDKKNAILASLLLVAQGIAAAAAPRLLGVAVDSAQSSPVYSMVLIGLGYFLLEAVRIFSTRLQAVEFSKIGQSAVHRLRLQTFHHILSLPWSEVRRLGPSDLLSRLTVDLRSASALFEACFLRIIERLCGVTAILIGIISISLPIGLAGIGFLPLLFLGGWYASRKLYTAFYARQIAFSGVTTSIADSIELAAETKLMGLSAKRVEHFSHESAQLAAVQQIPPLVFGRLHAAMSILTAISIGTILILGQQHIESGHLTRGELVTLVAYIGSIIWPLILIIDQWSVLLQGLASVDRIFEVLSLPIDAPAPLAISLQEQSETNSAAISFANVTFLYPETQRGVRNLSFSIQRGERIGIVGATGSGKSTISRLLLGLVKSHEGTVALAGTPISSLHQEKLRKTVAFLPQHPEMFSASPRENISLWDTDRDRFAEVLTNIPTSLKSLLDTEQDALATLSVGEQQCIAALRVLVRDPSIIVLDEPTSSIDPVLEQWLMDTIFTSSPQTTYLIIAHRLATLERCNRILVLEDGRLVAQGTHDELMRQSDKYRGLVEAEEASREG